MSHLYASPDFRLMTDFRTARRHVYLHRQPSTSLSRCLFRHCAATTGAVFFSPMLRTSFRHSLDCRSCRLMARESSSRKHRATGLPLWEGNSVLFVSCSPSCCLQNQLSVHKIPSSQSAPFPRHPGCLSVDTLVYLEDLGIAVPVSRAQSRNRQTPNFGSQVLTRIEYLTLRLVELVSTMWLLGVVATLAATSFTFVSGDSTFSPTRPPAVPLAVRSPYLNAWLEGGSGCILPGAWPRFWT